VSRHIRLLFCAIGVAAVACATAPRPTPESLRIGANTPAIVEGHVRDRDGRPVAGITVRGIPRGRDIPWSPPATTQCDGSFCLRLAAPGSYSFLLGWKGIAVMTPAPEDPVRLLIDLMPGEKRADIDLEFLGPEWGRVTDSAPAETPSCP
jgi:hypothetical protein